MICFSLRTISGSDYKTFPYYRFREKINGAKGKIEAKGIISVYI